MDEGFAEKIKPEGKKPKAVYVFIILGLMVFSIIIIIGAKMVSSGLSATEGKIPTQEETILQQLRRDCESLCRTYRLSQSESDRKSYCCKNSDINNDGEINEEEYCPSVTSCRNTNCNIQSDC